MEILTRKGACPKVARPGPWLLLTNKLPSQVAETALRHLAELIIVASFLADHQFAAVITGVEPLRGRDNARYGAATRAVEANSRAQLHKWSALRQFRGLLKLDPNPSSPLAVLLGGDRTDQDSIAAGGSAYLPPFSRSPRH